MTIDIFAVDDDEKAIRPCGNGWQYCDGKCEQCSRASSTCDNRTSSSNFDLHPKELLVD